MLWTEQRIQCLGTEHWHIHCMLLCFLITAQNEKRRNIYDAVLFETNLTEPYVLIASNNKELYFNNCLIHCNWERECLLCAHYNTPFIKILCWPFYFWQTLRSILQLSQQYNTQKQWLVNYRFLSKIFSQIAVFLISVFAKRLHVLKCLYVTL